MYMAWDKLVLVGVEEQVTMKNIEQLLEEQGISKDYPIYRG